MTDSDECQRGGEKETINHQIYECNYTNLLWNLGSQLTGLKNSNIKMMLGASELNDKATQTLHAELIRALLAIESNISQKRISFLQQNSWCSFVSISPQITLSLLTVSPNLCLFSLQKISPQRISSLAALNVGFFSAHGLFQVRSSA